MQSIRLISGAKAWEARFLKVRTKNFQIGKDFIFVVFFHKFEWKLFNLWKANEKIWKKMQFDENNVLFFSRLGTPLEDNRERL